MPRQVPYAKERFVKGGQFYGISNLRQPRGGRSSWRLPVKLRGYLLPDLEEPRLLGRLLPTLLIITVPAGPLSPLGVRAVKVVRVRSAFPLHLGHLTVSPARLIGRNCSKLVSHLGQ